MGSKNGPPRKLLDRTVHSTHREPDAHCGTIEAPSRLPGVQGGPGFEPGQLRLPSVTPALPRPGIGPVTAPAPSRPLSEGLRRRPGATGNFELQAGPPAPGPSLRPRLQRRRPRAATGHLKRPAGGWRAPRPSRLASSNARDLWGWCHSGRAQALAGSGTRSRRVAAGSHRAGQWALPSNVPLAALGRWA